MKQARWWRSLVAVDLLAVAAAVVGSTAGAWPRLHAPDVAFAALFGGLVLIVAGLVRPRPVNRSAVWVEPIDWVPTRLSLAAILSLLIEAAAGKSVSVGFALAVWATSVVGILISRTVLAIAIRRGDDGLTARTLIVGSGVVGARVAQRLREHPELGLRPVGFLDSEPMPHTRERARELPVLGSPSDVENAVQATGATHVVLAFSRERDAAMVPVVERCQELGLVVSIVPRLYETVNGEVTLERLGALPVLSVRPINLRGWRFTVKYLLDRVLALGALLVLAPLLATVALVVRFDSPGAIIFRQRRVGRDGETFDLFKFRTMKQAPVRGAATDAGAAMGEGASGFIPGAGLAPGGVEGADRRTRVGRFLRETSLDELPQLVNVLRGEMSLVGPRPERPEFVERFTHDVEHYAERHRVKAGLTGWAQVNGLRGQTSIDDRVEWDNAYIENWSFALECRTLLRTVSAVLKFREGTSASSAPSHDGAAPAGIGDLGAQDGAEPAVPFLVIDSRLTIEHASESAARLLDQHPEALRDRPVLQLLCAGDCERGEGPTLVSAFAAARTAEDRLSRLVVRPRGTFGVRMGAEISAAAGSGMLVMTLDPVVQQRRSCAKPPRRRQRTSASLVGSAAG